MIASHARAWSGAALLVAAAALPAAAQTAPTQPPPAPLAIPLPDTMGANYAIADSAKGLGRPTDYDFLLGMWTFRFQTRRADGKYNPPFTGHWTARKLESGSGVLIEDHWRGDNPNEPFASGTYSYRAYNPQRKVWEMQGVNIGGGQFAPGVAWSDAASHYVVQHYGPTTIMRIRYFAITPTKFLWRGDRSTDGGATWINDVWTMDAQRIGR